MKLRPNGMMSIIITVIIVVVNYKTINNISC